MVFKNCKRKIGMNSLAELKEEIEELLKIYTSSEISYNDNLYLSNPKTIVEKVVAENELFIKRAKFALGVLSILELNILFENKNNDYSLVRLLNMLLNNYKDSEWRNFLSKPVIKKWIDEYNSTEIQKSIGKIKTIRDQYFAHKDRTAVDFNSLLLTITEVENLFNYCKKVLYGIKLTVFKEYTYDVFPNETSNASNILNKLSYLVKKND